MIGELRAGESVRMAMLLVLRDDLKGRVRGVLVAGPGDALGQRVLREGRPILQINGSRDITEGDNVLIVGHAVMIRREIEIRALRKRGKPRIEPTNLSGATEKSTLCV